VASAGGLIDRFGPARFLTFALVMGAAGCGAFIIGHGLASAVVAAIMFGAGTSSVQTCVATLLARIVPQQQRGDAFGLSYALVNLGFGTGATVSGIVVNVHSARTFTVIFVAAAMLFLVFCAQLLLTGETQTQPYTARHGGKPVRSRFGLAPSATFVVLRDRRLLALTALNTLFITFGFSQLASSFAAWSTGPAGQATRVVGLAFTANTFTIVLTQLFVLRLVEGHSRLHTAAAAGLTFAATWVIVLAAGLAHAGLATTIGLIAALGVFGLGETLLAPSLPTAVNDLAPDAVRGRYNAVFFLSWPLGSIIGPLFAGAALQQHLGVPLLIGLACACLVGSAFALWLARFFSTSYLRRAGEVQTRDTSA
jgi:MFS family permease